LAKGKGVRSVNREALRMALNVPAGVKGELTERIRGDCTIERASLRIYIGAQLDLEIRPMIERAGVGGIREPLIRYCSGGKQYIDGDDDVYNWILSIPLEVDDKIVLAYSNNDVVNDYDFAFDFEVDYLGGVYRVPVVQGNSSIV